MAFNFESFGQEKDSTTNRTSGGFNFESFGNDQLEQPQEAPRSFAEKAIDYVPIIGSGIRAMKDVGQAINVGLYQKEAEENNKRYMTAGDQYMKIAKNTIDPKKRQMYLNLAQKSYEQAGTGIQDIVGELKTTKEILGDFGGLALDVATLGGVSTLGKAGVKTALSSGKALAKSSAISSGVGAAYGATGAMQENQGMGDIATSALTGAAIGAAIPTVAKGVGKAIKGVKTMASKENAIAKAEQELFNIENNYAKIRKASKYSKDNLSGSRKRILDADVLPGTVDDTGTIRTQEAAKKYKNEVIGKGEGVVKELLAKEGVSVSPNVIKLQLRKEILSSGLEGKQLKKALNAIDDEVEGLSLRSGETGNIPLTTLQDAKINAYGGINFQSDNWVKSEQKAIARAYKNVIENNSKHNVKKVNEELSKYYKDLDYLELLDGKKVKGGKLGKYTAQIAGNIAGAATGGMIGGSPGAAIGTVIGGELAGKIKGMMLSKAFGKSTGKVAQKSKILQKASEIAKSKPLQIEANQSYNLGSRNTMYNNIPTASSQIISPTIQKNEKMSTILSKKGSPSVGKTDPLIQEARKTYYHGTDAKFENFDVSTQKNGWLGKGHYFTPNKNYAKEAGKNLKEAVLDVKNPFVVKGDNPSDVLTEIKHIFPEVNEMNIKEVLQKNGYDGIKFKHWDKGEMISVFNPEQIKLKSQPLQEGVKTGKPKNKTKTILSGKKR